MSNASFRPRHRALCILGASALTSLLLATPAFAGDVYLGGLATAQTHQKFIVTYKDGSSALSSPSVLTTSLRTAARALPAKAGKPLGLNSVRRLAVGPELIQADRALDRAEAETLMRQLAADPNVQSVEVDQMLYPTLTPNDSRLSEQWAFGTTNAGRMLSPALVVPKAHCSDRRLSLGVSVLGRCGGSLSDIADAIIWASGGTVSGVPANPNAAEVINMSLGGGGTCSSTMQSAINGAVSRGTTVVVAAGNSAANVSGSLPANCANVIAVAATTSAGAKASYSNYGSGIDVSAPGSGILSTLNSGTTTPGNASYASYNGTSMAAPHVAGVVALVQSVAPTTLTPAAVETLLKNTARALPGACSGGCGAGIVDADAAVTAAIAGSSGGGGGGTGNTLTNGTPVTGLGAATGAELNYTITVPAGSGTLTVTTSGGSGDADLYVRAGSAPTDTVYACRPYLDGNAETCNITSPSGTYYVRIKAYSTFSGVTLTASY
ncbi:S8 family serine peptidase [Xanthomonas perforans]|uniref:S8 family serine peptidase n=1 Tax=Xanthomonas perforans TaxID=442694 RepID=UPI00115D92E6|nr:S8 family serine peptidase [Xanthomonas perforans]TQT56673.1 peptidase S8 [Xanthomonas perforans]